MKKSPRIFVFLSLPFLLCGCVDTSSSTTNSSSNIISVTSVSLNANTISLYVGETFNFVTTILPDNASDKSFTYKVDDLTIASIDNNGLLTSLSKGETTLTVTSNDNSLTDTCSVTVLEKDDTKPVVNVTSVSLNENSKTLETGATFKLEATVLPSNASDKSVTWSSSDSSIVGVNEGLVTANKVGSATISVTTVDGNYKASCNFTIIEKDTSNIASITSNNTKTNQNTKIDTFSSNAFVTANINVTSIVGSSIYPGENNSYRFASSKNAGSLTFTFDKILIKGISILAKSYGSDNSYVTISSNAIKSGQTINISSTSQQNYDYSSFSGGEETTSLTISSNKSNRFYLYSINLIIGSIEPVYPTSISLPSLLNIAIGESTNLNVSVLPSNYNQGTIKYEISNSSVAIINNGVVSGIAEGSATISASINDANGIALKATAQVVVSPVSVNGVSLSNSTLTITVGKTKNLSATVTPNNATNKAINWSTSNSSVATVKDGVVSALAVGNATISVTTVDGNYKATCLVTVEDVSLADWTIMIYMCGSDLESGYDSEEKIYTSTDYLASGDIDEIINSGTKPENVNVILQTGGAKRWRPTSSKGYGISSKNVERWHVSESKTLVKDASLSQLNMGLSSTFQSFLEWGLSSYPADRTAVILWNHGGGLRGVCYDENFDYDTLTNDEVVSAFGGAFKTVGRTEKLEFIGYDACLMQTQEVAEMNSQYFNYMVASEESENGYGWDYDGGWLGNIYKNAASINTETILKGIVDSFINDNGGVNGTGYSYGRDYYPADQTMSYLDLSKMSAYKDAWEDMAGALKNKITSSNKSSFNSNLIGKTKYFASTDYDYFCLFDSYHFLTLLENNSTFNVGSSLINNVKTTFSELVKYSVSQKEGAKDAYGLCFYYVAGTGYEQSSYATSQYSNFTNWTYISSNFGGRITSSYSYK